MLAEASGDEKSLTFLMTVLAGGIALLLFLILALRLQAFLALIISAGAVYVAAGQPLTEVGDTLVKGMGSSLGFIATIIGLGAIFGQILEHSGGAQTLAKGLLRGFGEKRASWAMMVAGFIVSIPVFLDVALVILAPIIFALAKDTKKSVLAFGLPLVVGLAVTHAFVPPTPGPVWVAYQLDVSLGWVIAMGVLVGLPTAIICGPILCPIFANRLHIEPPEWAIDDEPPESAALPPFGLIAAVIGGPILLILAGTVVETQLAAGLPEGLDRSERAAALTAALGSAPFGLQLLRFLGHPVIALLLATLTAITFLGAARGVSKEKLLELSTRALGPAGIIILITGAGGVFKQVLGDTGIADALSEAFADKGVSPLLLAYLFALLVRVAQGSATVAMVTAAGLMTGFVEGMSAPMTALVVICVAAGATALSHVNDSGFWIISRYLNMSEKQTLQTWTILSLIISLVGFGFALIVSLFVR